MWSKNPKEEKIDQRFVNTSPNIFNDVGLALTSTLNIESVIQTIVESVQNFFHPQFWSLLLKDEISNQLYFKITRGENSDRLKDELVDMGEGICGWVAENGKPLFIQNVSEDTRYSPRLDQICGHKTESSVCLPLISKGKILGVIEFNNLSDKDSWHKLNFELLTTIANFASIGLENARYVQRIKNMTITDDLTGLFNSRYLNRFLEYETERSRRYNTVLSLVFIDLDDFKKINDNHGHLSGSKILKEIGELLYRNVRKVDMACRYGGDEFIVVMPQTSKDSAYQVALKIRQKFNTAVFLEDEGINAKITASFGIAAMPDDTPDPRGLVQLADNAMYKVKESHKDGVILA